MKLFIVALLAVAQLASAHFELVYPYWRGDSFLPPASQYTFPCAGVNTTTESNANRTLWPLDGGSLVIDFHHPWTYVAFNLGFGSDIATFNISLNPMLLNETGNGTICIPKWTLPADLGVVDGMDASLQVITIGDSGTALYNCADIRFSANATILAGAQCQNSTGVDIYPLAQQQANGSSAAQATATVTVTASAGGATPTNAAMRASAPHMAGFAWSMGLGLVVALGLGY
ncbi:uncharacterized protein Z519_09490 [Cladophialophora bantiana CBS 173.52]|uniref:Copper acquisition factor BIM1-like domain-containing protein n=1 Tax=Cladophialophora bantiana (strain ATCC 10958 / CBS 173.52 / CDC B-1940 / NIH 8579) TaxID=1442370 RepID=A0A0D2HZR4_CLAB1|nr:uncharacterized protein Z519_09490 [Cladophialophora bantiana CBS 173.52]KIW90059.1 hypothetical protein Z519_09490 [Cladophialophora bantiana CBS 173.52]